MKKGNVKKNLEWFFEEDKSTGLEENEEETIEINLFQALMIIIITMCFLFFIFHSHLKTYFKAPMLTASEYIDSKIEKNFFEENQSLENGDFNRGLRHWVSSDGGGLFPLSKSVITLEKKDFHSAPYSMKIESLYPANRIHYTKSSRKHIVNNAYGYKETRHWLGVIAGTDILVSLWYKGDIVVLSVNGLSVDGQWRGLGKSDGPASDEWSPLSLRLQVPLDIRAIALEITLNQAQGMPSPELWIDDVKVEVENNEK